MYCLDTYQHALMSMSEQASAYPAAGTAMHESLMCWAAGVHGHDDTPRALMPLKPYAHNACIARPPAFSSSSPQCDLVLPIDASLHGLGVAQC